MYMVDILAPENTEATEKRIKINNEDTEATEKRIKKREGIKG